MRQRRRSFGSGSWAWLWVVLVASVCSSMSVYAQWEWVYGNPCTQEHGQNGVTPVMNCGGGGYIAVGYAEIGCNMGIYDSYIVRVNGAGAVLWEETVDITGVGGNDIAYSVVEIPAGGGVNGGGGFLVVGTTDEPAGTGSTDCYAMEVDCNGIVIWVQTYGTAGVPDEARDVTLTLSGNGIPPIPGGLPPQAGDYVIAGWTFAGLPVTQDALLFRVTPAGGVVWNSAFNLGGLDWLNAVIESRVPNQWGTTGDIVAVGGTNSLGNSLQGLALRVDGMAGRFIAVPPQGLADYGGATNEVFNSVTELTFGNAANLVFAGFTTSNAPSDIYIVRTSANPCALLAQNVVTGAAGGDVDVAYDIVEAQNNYRDAVGNLVVVRGDLVLTGETNNTSQSTEMFLLTLNQIALNVAGVAKTYGDILAPGLGIFADGGRSLADDFNGFIICGYTRSNFLYNNDPEQLYLVKTTGAGVSNCENPWNPGNQNVPWVPGCWLPPITSPLTMIPLTRLRVKQVTGDSVCPRQPCIIRLPDNGNDGGHQGVSDVDPKIEMSSLRFYPNPVKRGGAVTLEFTSTTSEPIEVTVTNTLGETVERITTKNEGGLSRLGFRTGDLPAGVYIIEVSDGSKKETVRIVVTE